MQVIFNSKDLESRLTKLVDLDQFDLSLAKGARDIQARAKAVHRYTTRTGALDNSIVTTHERLKHSVGIDRNIAEYGTYQHDGTKAHMVKPKNGKALRFQVGGRFVYSKGHKVSGIKADRFIIKAWNAKKSAIINGIVKNLRQYIYK